jgi:hypothetical protein
MGGHGSQPSCPKVLPRRLFTITDLTSGEGKPNVGQGSSGAQSRPLPDCETHRKCEPVLTVYYFLLCSSGALSGPPALFSIIRMQYGISSAFAVPYPCRRRAGMREHSPAWMRHALPCRRNGVRHNRKPTPALPSAAPAPCNAGESSPNCCPPRTLPARRSYYIRSCCQRYETIMRVPLAS